jgi:hypothetical protein
MEIVEEFRSELSRGGLRGALRALNQRAPHRFTGVYRFDGDMLRNVALFDRWNPDGEVGADAPMSETFCAIVPSQGVALEVSDGPSDERFPWMQDNAVVCYCGALLRDEAGEPWGTVCHFDVQRCEAARSHLPELLAVAPSVYEAVRSK